MSITIRPVAPGDRTAWEALFRGYAEFYRTDPAPAIEKVWAWINDANEDYWADIAWGADGTALGLVQYSLMHRSLSGAQVVYLSDLFTVPEARGQGVGRALLGAAVALGRSGALLLSDFLVNHPAVLTGATVLDLGTGAGLTSLVAACYARRVYATDIGAAVLDNCARNVARNGELLPGTVLVRELDWTARPSVFAANAAATTAAAVSTIEICDERAQPRCRVAGPATSRVLPSGFFIAELLVSLFDR